MEEKKFSDETAKFLQDRIGEGFDFSLANRNAMLSSKGINLPKFTKTGTTIAGIVFKDGVILGADTRATNGPIVAQKKL